MAFFFEAVCAVRSLFSSDGELGENLSVLFTLCVKMWKCLHPHTCSLQRCGGVLGWFLTLLFLPYSPWPQSYLLFNHMTFRVCPHFNPLKYWCMHVWGPPYWAVKNRLGLMNPLYWKIAFRVFVYHARGLSGCISWLSSPHVRFSECVQIIMCMCGPASDSRTFKHCEQRFQHQLQILGHHLLGKLNLHLSQNIICIYTVCYLCFTLFPFVL